MTFPLRNKIRLTLLTSTVILSCFFLPKLTNAQVINKIVNETIIDTKSIFSYYQEPMFTCPDKMMSDKCVYDQDVIKYYKIETLPTNKNILDYSTEKIDENHLKIYEGIQFVKEIATGNWYELQTPEYTTISNFTKSFGSAFIKKNGWFINIAFADEYTYYPDPNIETNTFDGYAYEGHAANYNLLNWSQIRAAAGNSSSDNDDWLPCEYMVSDTNSGMWRYNVRCLLLFNTANIPDSATISSSTLSIYGSARFNELGLSSNAYLVIATSTPASDTSIANGDYQQIGKNELSDHITYDNFSVSGYNKFTLSNYTVINKTGITKLGILDGYYDLLGNTPAWQSNKTQSLEAHSSDAAGTSNDPYLWVEYTAETCGNASCAGGETCETCPDDCGECESTSTPVVYNGSCEPDNINDLSFITSCSYASSSGITYTDYHIPFIIYLILAIPFLYIISRLVIEFLIRWRA